MNKRGQFSILVAVIVCLIVFIIVKEYNWIKPTIDLEDLQNFQEKSQ